MLRLRRAQSERKTIVVCSVLQHSVRCANAEVVTVRVRTTA